MKVREIRYYSSAGVSRYDEDNVKRMKEDSFEPDETFDVEVQMTFKELRAVFGNDSSDKVSLMKQFAQISRG